MQSNAPHLPRVFVHDLAFALAGSGGRFMRFEREERVITHLHYRGHYGVIVTSG